jgi:hypothetical protein
MKFLILVRTVTAKNCVNTTALRSEFLTSALQGLATIVAAPEMRKNVKCLLLIRETCFILFTNFSSLFRGR